MPDIFGRNPEDYTLVRDLQASEYVGPLPSVERRAATDCRAAARLQRARFRRAHAISPCIGGPASRWVHHQQHAGDPDDGR